MKGGTTRICATCTEKRDSPKALRERRVVGETEEKRRKKKPTTQKAIFPCKFKTPFNASIFDLSDHSLFQHLQRKNEFPNELGLMENERRFFSCLDSLQLPAYALNNTNNHLIR
jgi:hypothetical protein